MVSGKNEDGTIRVRVVSVCFVIPTNNNQIISELISMEVEHLVPKKDRVVTKSNIIKSLAK